MERKIHIQFKSSTSIVLTTFAKQKHFNLNVNFIHGDKIDLIALEKIKVKTPFYAELDIYDKIAKLNIYAMSTSDGFHYVGHAKIGEFNYNYVDSSNNYIDKVDDGIFKSKVLEP